MYINLLQAKVKNNPQEIFVGLCVFFVTVMGTSVQHVASTSFALLFIASFFIIKDWGNTWRQLSKNEKWLLTGFGLYALSGVVAYVNVEDTQEYIKDLERYLRFLAAVPIYLFVKKYKIDVIKYLYAGVIVSGPFLFYIAFSAYLINPGAPANGYYHHIIFGGVAVLNVGIMFSMLQTVQMSFIVKGLVVVAIILCSIAALLSWSRGVWLVLPVYLLIVLYYSIKHSKVGIFSIVLGGVLITGIVALSPIGDIVEQRTNMAVDEVQSFYTHNQYETSLGTRLAMWEIAIDVWKEHPVIGTGPGDFDEDVRYLQNNGEYVGMPLHSTTHNMYFQALVNTGAVGFLLTMFFLYLVPLKIFMRQNVAFEAASYSGFMFIAFFSVIGLSMSWTMRLPTVSVYIVYLFVLVSSATVTNEKHV